MAVAQDIRRKLLDKLKELFQLDRPDLDFGFYKIMHARAREVTEFIDHQLLAEVERAFSSLGPRRRKPNLRRQSAMCSIRSAMCLTATAICRSFITAANRARSILPRRQS